MRKFRYWGWFLVLLIWACSSDGADDQAPIDDDVNMTDDDVPVTFDRSAMLTNWADNIILPSYDSFVNELSNFQSVFESFKADASESNLIQLRQAWLSTYLSWQKVSMFEIGPAESIGLRLNINTYPSDTALIEQFVAAGSYDLSLPSNRDAKGFPALDYLINGLAETDAEIVSFFGTETGKEGYLSYFEDVLEDMIGLTGQVANEWESGYRDTFVANDGSSSTASVDRFVNDFIFYYEKFLRAGKMGIPLGVFTGSIAPNTLEAYYKEDVSNELFLAGLDAVQDFFNGKHFDENATGESLASYLQDLNTLKNGEELDALINQQFDLARDRVSGLNPFKAEIENNNPPTDMLMAYDEVQRAVPLLKVDMVSAMSISIDFVDADGD
ncbi:imelysin family protein [Allomuricauda sp. d1]|uniref:imelysin family protein n=1 Tax=Allomuricauda sp. d1 TaxID=3136725 RepID=UPI0031E0B5F9